MDILKDFGVEPVLLAAQIVNFVILLLILKRFLYGPILKQLDKRRKQIIDDEKNSKEIAETLEKIKKQEQLSKNKAQKEAEKIISDAKNYALIESQKIIDDANLQAEKINTATRIKIDAERQTSFDEAKKEILNLIILATGRLTGKILSKNEQIELAQKAIKEIQLEQKKS